MALKKMLRGRVLLEDNASKPCIGTFFTVHGTQPETLELLGKIGRMHAAGEDAKTCLVGPLRSGFPAVLGATPSRQPCDLRSSGARLENKQDG